MCNVKYKMYNACLSKRGGKGEFITVVIFWLLHHIPNILRNIKRNVNCNSSWISSYFSQTFLLRPCVCSLSLYSFPSEHHAHLMKNFNIGWGFWMLDISILCHSLLPCFMGVQLVFSSWSWVHIWANLN